MNPDYPSPDERRITTEVVTERCDYPSTYWCKRDFWDWTTGIHRDDFVEVDRPHYARLTERRRRRRHARRCLELFYDLSRPADAA